MDPVQLTPEQWDQIGLALRMLWLALLAAVIAGPSLVVAHAVIPSAVATRTFPSRAALLRPFFYLLGLAGVAGIGIFLAIAALNMDWLSIYTRWWI